MTLEVVERIVDATLETDLRACRRPAEGAVADTYCLELAGEPPQAVCKLGGASVWTGDVIELLVTRLVEERTDLPVPRVLASGSLEPPAGELERWALYEHLEGTTPERYRDLERGSTAG